MGYTISTEANADEAGDDTLNYIFSTAMWKDVSNNIKIGVHKSDN